MEFTGTTTFRSADDGVDAAFPSSLRIVYRPFLFGEKFGFDAVDSRFSDKVV